MKLLKNLLDKFRLWWGTHFRCHGCGQVVSRRNRSGYYSIIDENGRRSWCRGCAVKDSEIGAKIKRMDEIRSNLRYDPNFSDPSSTEQA